MYGGGGSIYIAYEHIQDIYLAWPYDLQKVGLMRFASTNGLLTYTIQYWAIFPRTCTNILTINGEWDNIAQCTIFSSELENTVLQ
jgi:hypothetical protein